MAFGAATWAAITAATAVASLGVGAYGQYQQAQAQEQYQRTAYERQVAYAAQMRIYEQKLAETQRDTYVQQAEAAVANQQRMIDWTVASNRQQADMFVANAELANSAYITTAGVLNDRIMEEEDATVAELDKIRRERVVAQGTALASSERAGLSMAALLRDYDRSEAYYRDSTLYNFDATKSQLGWEKESARSQAIGRINSFTWNPQSVPQVQAPVYQPYTPRPVQNPNYGQQVSYPNLWATGLQMVGAGMQGYGNYKMWSDPRWANNSRYYYGGHVPTYDW